SLLRAQTEEALALCAGISEEKSLHRYAPEKWTIREVLNHINDTERAFAFRAATLSFFRNLPGDAWMRSGIASDNRFTVRALAYITAGHVAHHAAIVR